MESLYPHQAAELILSKLVCYMYVYACAITQISKNMQHPVLFVDEPTPHPNYSPEGAEGDPPTTSDPERGACKQLDAAAAEPGLIAPTGGYYRPGQP